MGAPVTSQRAAVAAYTLVILFGSTSCLKIVGVDVPSLADLRQPVVLGCTYDTELEALYSVKWYRDDNEFFRYTPSTKPNVLAFEQPGGLVVTPDDAECGRTVCRITLNQLTPLASGSYTCEVSTDAPTFRTAMATMNMTVAAVPLRGPQIEGLRTKYAVGDTLEVSCKSASSAPPTKVTLLLNSAPIESKHITTLIEPDGPLFSSSARIHLVLTRLHFKASEAGVLGLTLRCLSELPGAPSTAMNVEETASLTTPPPLHNQKLEWPSAGGIVASPELVIYVLLIFCLQRIIFE